MSVFVNPLQFDHPDDLARYPRDLDRDAIIAADAGVDLLFAPPAGEMYPAEPLTRVQVGVVSESPAVPVSPSVSVRSVSPAVKVPLVSRLASAWRTPA